MRNFAIAATILVLSASCSDSDWKGKGDNYAIVNEEKLTLYNGYTDLFPGYDNTNFEIYLSFDDSEYFSDDLQEIFMDIYIDGIHAEPVYDIYGDLESYTIDIPSATYKLGVSHEEYDNLRISEISIDYNSEIMPDGNEYGSYYSYDVASGELTVKHHKGNRYTFSFSGEFENGLPFEFSWSGEIQPLDF